MSDGMSPNLQQLLEEMQKIAALGLTDKQLVFFNTAHNLFEVLPVRNEHGKPVCFILGDHVIAHPRLSEEDGFDGSVDLTGENGVFAVVDSPEFHEASVLDQEGTFELMNLNGTMSPKSMQAWLHVVTAFNALNPETNS